MSLPSPVIEPLADAGAPAGGRAAASRATAWRWPWRWPWPLPALAAWACGWAVFVIAAMAGLAPAAALLLGCIGSWMLAWPCRGAWRRLIAWAGFPASAWALGAAAAWSPWAWALAGIGLLGVYPLRAWRDAPFFPTPAHALDGLADVIARPPLTVLDAGCGLGHGLVALREQWPQARVEGVEWSRPLAWLARRRCRWAAVRRGDLWADDWSRFDLVYVFQRPESMPRVGAKALRQMRPGSWLVSLEFAWPGARPLACLQGPGRRPVWVYRVTGSGPHGDHETGATQ
jgi:SAM-dependent methyltransferase